LPSAVGDALAKVQEAINPARRLRRTPELDLVGLGEGIPESICEQVERDAGERGLDEPAVVATIGLRLRGDGTSEEANRQAKPFLEAAAECGDAMAAGTLGMVILDLREDRRQARRWLLQGAEATDSQALYNLGKMEREDGNRPEAKRRLEESEDQRAKELLAEIGAEAR
jgi:hypothetical protein